MYGNPGWQSGICRPSSVITIRRQAITVLITVARCIRTADRKPIRSVPQPGFGTRK